MSGDPFLQVQQDVLAQLATTQNLAASHSRIASLSTTSNNPELQASRSDLLESLAVLSEDLNDLADAVAAVEASPAAYGLSTAEVARRRALVHDVTAQVSAMRAAVDSAGNKPVTESAPGPSDQDYTAEFEELQQQEIMRVQDEQLDDVFQTVGNLRRQADDMGRELEEQREMLEEVDAVADRVGTRLQTGMQQMQYVIRRNEDTLSSCCIGVLVITLIVLLVLLLIV